MKLIVRNLIFSILVSVLFLSPANSVNALEGLARFDNRKDTTVFLQVAATPEEKTKGLMNVTNLPSNRGMVFIFRPAITVTFWMKDTLISLDMIFINNGEIVKIVRNALPNQTSILYPSDKEVTEVIEVNSGFSDAHEINVGDTVEFENISQIDYSVDSKLMILKK